MYDEAILRSGATRRFGLIGYPLSHSFSEKYFSSKFRKEGLNNCRYELFPIAAINDLPHLLQEKKDLQGLNVTIPYKKLVMPYLAERTGIPYELEACNCISIREGKLYGHNTDIAGFEKSIQPLLLPHHTHALVLGTGGAAAAVLFVLRKLGINVTGVSRNAKRSGIISYTEITQEIIESHHIIINTTPLGMFPDIDTCPSIPYQYLTGKHLLYDLTYNPGKSLFLQKGEEKGALIKNGEEMLIIQAEESWRIWNE